MKPAVVIIDMLNDFFNEGPLKERRASLARNINQLVDAARTRGIPIIWVRQEFEPDLSDAYLMMRKRKKPETIKGTPGARILEELNKEPGDTVIVKKRYSAFFRTNLDNILAENGIDRLILAGINTHACVRMAAIDAYQRDHEVVLARDCIGSWDNEHHEITLRYLERGMGMQLLSNEQIIKQYM